MAIIGETLAVPEYGFTRYEFINKDDLTLNNEYFYSIGTFITQDANGLLAVGVSNGDEILVKIKNTYNFRLLVCLPSSTNANTLYTNNMVVEIDGTKHTFDLTSNRNTTIIDNCLAVDIKNLSTNSHIVKIYADGNNNDTQMINVQAIDIDVRGVVGFTRTMASMFEGCTNLKKDIIIPKNADIVENMFKNCTSMTHVHSNWDETYDDSGIITEGCYSGCASITHIDDVVLNLNEYTNGLDNIPAEWGGYGFTSEYSGIYMIEILSPNYTFSFASDGLLDGKYINWGDGTITQNEYSHTYVNAGVYIIKGQVHSPTQTATDSMKLCLKEIIQYPIYGNLYYAFAGCTALVSANISGNKHYDTTRGRASVFSGCTNLERVIALDTKLEKEASHISAFQNCKKLREIIGLEDFIYNTNNIMSSFNGCSSLPNFTLSEDTLKNCISFMLAFCGCTSLTESPIKTFNVSDISRMFEGCTNITDISGVTFGKNITLADEWYPPNLTTVNNVTIKNDVVSFQGNTTLQYCNNLRSYYAKSFRDCTALVELKNLLIKSEDGTVINAYGDYNYRDCSKLKKITFDPNCNIKYISCDNMFFGNPLLEEVDFGGGVTLEPEKNGGYVFSSTTLKTIKNMKVGGASTVARFSGYSVWDYGDDFTNLEYLDCTIMTQKASKFFKGSGIKDVSNIKFDTSIRDLSESFMNNRLLLQDVEVQSHIRNCSSMFRNCTALTHIRSNWNNSYTGGITATGCYSGCTAITHIDNKNVIAYEGDMGIDYVPSEWGGNGLDKSNTTVLRINLTSNNYNVCISGIDQPNGVTSWGDGTSDSSIAHTYSTAGTYIIKTQKMVNTSSPNATIKQVLTDVLALSSYSLGGNGQHYLKECAKLKTVNMDDYVLKSPAGSLCLFYLSQNIEYISAKNLTIQNNGFGCSPIGQAQGRGNDVLTEIVGVDTWKIETDDLSYLFAGFHKLESLNISNWNLENVTNMSNMFDCCRSLTESPIKNFPNSVWNISNMFKDCTSLTHDIEIPSHITNCSNMFQGCTSMTHIRSNWNNSYTNGITSTGCYSGCTAISHIDDKNVIAYEGDVGLDYLPSEWGGNGFDKSNTAVLRINLTSNNYNVCLSAVDQPNGVTSWGDGTSDTSMAHTYSTAGTYILKTQKTVNTASVNATLRQVLTDVLSLSSYPLSTNSSPHFFRECSKLKTVNMDDHILRAPESSPLFYDCYNIEYISAKNVIIQSNGFGYSRGTYYNTKLTEIVGVETWKIETNNIKYLFKGFTKLESLDISSWNLENVTDMSNMFESCESLEEIILPNMNVGAPKNLYLAFGGCSNLRAIQGKIENFYSHEEMFKNAPNIEIITDGMDFSKDSSAAHLCSNTTNTKLVNLTITGSYNINAGTSIHMWQQFPSLSAESLVQLLNALVNLKGQSSKSLVLGSTNLAKLSSTQKRIATDKNWTLA